MLRFTFIVLVLSLFMAPGLAGNIYPDKADDTIQCGDIHCVSVHVGDLNNDRKPDIIACSYHPKNVKRNVQSVSDDQQTATPFTNGVLCYFQKESGFSATPDLFFPSKNPRGIVVKDFDGDGKNDVAVSQRRRRLLLYYARDDFKEISNYNANMNSIRLLDVRLNHSKREKSTVSLLANATWWQIMKNGNVRSTYIRRPPKNQSGQVGVGDLNNDGETDLVYPQCGRLLLYYGPIIFCRGSINPNMLLEYVVIDTSKTPGVKPGGEKKESHPEKKKQLSTASITKSKQTHYYEAYIADFNGDCRMDIVTLANDSIAFFFQNAPIGFDQVQPVKLMGKFRQFQVGDLNNDGLTDLVAIDRNGKAIRIFLQKRGKNFAKSLDEADQIIASSGAYQLTLADINLDGKTDLLLAKYSTGVIQIFLNQL